MPSKQKSRFGCSNLFFTLKAYLIVGAVEQDVRVTKKAFNQRVQGSSKIHS